MVALFDLGNVLVRLAFPRGLSRLAALGGRCGGVASSELKRDFDTGRIGVEDFLRGLDAPGAPRATLAEAWCDVFDPWPEMEAVLGEVLASGRPSYLLSNTDPLHYSYLSRRIPALPRMTGHQLSFERGLLKPDPAFFRDALERFGLSAGECVFLDDLAENVRAAESLGVRGHVVTADVAATRAALGLS